MPSEYDEKIKMYKTEKMKYEAEYRQIQVQKERGLLVSVDEVLGFIGEMKDILERGMEKGADYRKLCYVIEDALVLLGKYNTHWRRRIFLGDNDEEEDQ